MGLTLTPRIGAAPQLDTPGFFGGDSGISYEELQARKRIARELMGGNGQIRTIGEGINSAAGSIAGAMMKRRADKDEGKQRESFNEAFNSVVPGLFGGGYSSTVSTKTPDASAPIQAASYDAGDWTRGHGEGVNPQLIEVLNAVREKTGIPFVITEGLRDVERQKQMVAQGKSQTMKSKHLGGGAVDIAIMGPDGKPNYDFEAYRPLGEEFKRTAEELGYPGAVWGGDWQTLRDGVHFQLPVGGGAATATLSTQNAPAGIRTAQAGGIDPTIIQQLAQLAGSPYANEGQRAIVQALLGQQLQSMQPPQKRDTQWVPNVGLIDTQTGEIISAAPTGSGTDQTEYGVTPHYIVREDGSLGMVVFGKDGTAKEVELPEGAAIQKGVEKLDLGTSYQWYNTLTGEAIGQPIPKDIAEAEAEKARGKAEGEAYVANRAELPKVEAQATEAINLIDSIMNDPALASITGNIQGNLPAGIPFVTGGQAGANLMPKIRQLQGQVFLQAYESLRGAQAITDVEGRKATEAKARLDRAQDEKTYREALMELRDIVQTGLARARAKAGVSEPAAAQQAAPSDMPQVGDVVDGYRFNGGAPWDEKNWEPVQ